MCENGTVATYKSAFAWWHTRRVATGRKFQLGLEKLDGSLRCSMCKGSTVQTLMSGSFASTVDDKMSAAEPPPATYRPDSRH